MLADENFPRALVEDLRTEGHDVLWVLTDCSGWKDVVLLDLAEADSRIVLTLDKDFWQIAVQRRVPLRAGGVVLFRVRPAILGHLRPLVRMFATADRSWVGYISIISKEGIQMLAALGGG